MRRFTLSWILLVSLIACTSLPALAFQRPKNDPKPANDPQNSYSSSTSAVMSFPEDDHIFCELSEESLLQLRPRPEYPTLNELQAEQLRRQILLAVGRTIDKDDHSNDLDFRRRRDVFLREFGEFGNGLVGLTLAQAQNEILKEIAELQQPQQDSHAPNDLVPTENSRLAKLKSDVGKISPETIKTLGIQIIADKLRENQPVTYGDLSQLQKALGPDNLKQFASKNDLNQNVNIQRAVSTFQAAASRLKQSDSFSYDPTYSLGYKLSDDLDDADEIYRSLLKEHTDWSKSLDSVCSRSEDTRLSCQAKTFTLKATQLQALIESKRTTEAVAINDASAINDVQSYLSFGPIQSILNVNLEGIAAAAHKAISAFAKPEDVGCAMTILPWNNMRYTFGQKVADEFLGVQVTVRNLNAEKEFLLHGADLAVDMDLSSAKPLHSRFFSGVDKQNVRAYMLAARDYDTRSLWVHSAEGLSTLLGSVAPIWGGVVTDASSVFAGGFLPAMTHVWTDSHTEQLNQLNDVGFSASRNDRTFVPKSGSTQFVIFVPVRPLEQAWWTQKCVEAIPLGRSNAAPPSPTGLDIDASRRICYSELDRAKSASPAANSRAVRRKAQGPYSADPDKSDGTAPVSIDPGLHYFLPAQVKYRKWTPTTYALLKELSFSIIAGTHVTLSSDTHPDITTVKCPPNESSNIDLTAANNGVITCNLTGVNFDKADHVTLRAATDTQTVDAPLHTSNGGKVATLDLKVSDLCPLKKSAYSLYTVTSNGIEDGGAQEVELSLKPYLTEAPSSVSVSSGPLKLSLKGCHLDDLQAIKLGDNSHKTIDLPASDQTASSATIEVNDPANKAIFGNWPQTSEDQSLALSIILVSKSDQSHPQDSKQTLSVRIPAKSK